MRHRRAISAVLAGLAALLIVRIAAPAVAATVPVVVAAHDLAAGTRVAGSDVQIRHFPPGVVPVRAATTLGEVVGEVVAGPMRAGEPVTDRRLLGSALLDGLPAGRVAAPVRLQDGDSARLLQPGDAITVYAAAGDGASYASVVVQRTRVVTIPAVDDGQQGGLVVLAVTASEAAALAQAAATAPLSIALLR